MRCGYKKCNRKEACSVYLGWGVGDVKGVETRCMGLGDGKRALIWEK